MPDATPLGEPVELAGPWPPHAPVGMLVLSEHEDGTLTIDHADPAVTFSQLLIDEAMLGLSHPSVTAPMDVPITNGHVGALLKIQAANRQVVYRITEWLPSIRAYIGEWPE